MTPPRMRRPSAAWPHMGPWLFALFLTAGHFKADPRLAFIQNRFDLTILFFILSFFALLWEVFKSGARIFIPRGFVKPFIYFYGLVVVLWVGILLNHSIGYGLQKTLRFTVLTGWAFMGAGLFIRKHDKLSSFLWAIFTISLVMSGDTLVNYLSGKQAYFVTAMGTNYLGLGRIAGIGLLANLGFLILANRRRLVKLFLGGAAFLQLVALLVAGGRGPVAAFIFSFFAFIFLSVRRFKVNRSVMRIGLVFLVITAVVVTALPGLTHTLWIRSRLLLTEGGRSVQTRLMLQQTAIVLWARSPIWGVGPGGFSMSVRGADARLYPHNILLELASETGIIGVTFFVAMIIVGFGHSFKSLRCAEGLDRVVPRFLLVAGLFLLINAMVSGDINDNRMLFAFISLLSIAKVLGNGKPVGTGGIGV